MSEWYDAGAPCGPSSATSSARRLQNQQTRGHELQCIAAVRQPSRRANTAVRRGRDAAVATHPKPDLRRHPQHLTGPDVPSAIALEPLDPNDRARALCTPHVRVVLSRCRPLARLVAHPSHVVPRLALDRALGRAGAYRASSQLADMELDNEEGVWEALDDAAEAAANRSMGGSTPRAEVSNWARGE